MKKCAIYVRVSTSEQAEEGYSLSAQTELLRAYAKRQGLTPVREYVEAASGSKGGRRQFARMLEEAGDLGVSAIVVEKVDRLYRNFPDAVKVGESGLEVHFVKESLSLGSGSVASDHLMHNVLTSVASFFAQNLRQEVIKGMEQKGKSGIWPSYAPLGYLNEGKEIVPDRDRAPLVREIFEAYARGLISLTSAAAYAREIGLKTRDGNALARSSIARMLANPLYMGIVRWGRVETQGRHEPIVSPALFAQVQEILQGRSTRAGFGHRDILYKGLIKCGHCGCAVTASVKKGKYVYYGCTGSRDSKCPGRRLVKEEEITAQYERLFGMLEIPPDALEWLKAALKEAMSMESKWRADHTARMRREETILQKRLDAIYVDKLDGKVGQEQYDRLSREWADQLTAIRAMSASVGSASAAACDFGLLLMELAQTAGARFRKADMATKRELLAEIQQSAEICGGTLAVTLNPPFESLVKAGEEWLSGGQKVGDFEIWYSALDSIANRAIELAARAA